MMYLVYALWGGIIGVLSGVIGIGGGILIVPTLVFMFGLTQHQAQGTSIAMMIPPIGLMAAIRYYQDGNIVIPIAVLGAVGFFIGGYFGAGLAQSFSEVALRRTFGAVLMLIGLKMLWS
ncbi:MAG TPA: sulfite exporter TauE/SafE family protein [Candidatus Ozemobacteraceae bacterium]|nr:sulfite exporter TauE/SafE family protein [Candidatus Ozemobacteraceae bacterium]